MTPESTNSEDNMSTETELPNIDELRLEIDDDGLHHVTFDLS